MATKTISITEEAYERLKMYKNQRESFSDVIHRITKRNKLSDFYGMLGEKAMCWKSGQDLKGEVKGDKWVIEKD